MIDIFFNRVYIIVILETLEKFINSVILLTVGNTVDLLIFLVFMSGIFETFKAYLALRML